MKISTITFLTILLFSSSSFSRTSFVADKSDSLIILEKYSLFSEYYKNKDYESALPFGWEVLEMDPAKFSKWIYRKMDKCLTFMHDSSDASPEYKQAIEDTILGFYDMAMTYNSDRMAEFQLKKAFATETWFEFEPEVAMAEYEKAFEYNPEVHSYYYHRLGQIYESNIADDNDYKMKAKLLYSDLALKEPDNPLWNERLLELVDDMSEILDISEKAWNQDKEKLGKAWDYAKVCMGNESWERAIVPLEFLTEKSPETVNYWNQLATAYQKVDQLSNAETALNKLIEIDPDNKDHYMNLGIVYKDQGRLSKARQLYQKASSVGGGWALPIFYEGLLYEQTARGCSFDFNAKIVYQIAVSTYRKAYNMDESLSQARDRIGALSSSVPTQEDYFFQKYKSGDVIPVTSACGSWIGKSVTVP
ncbi:MAG: tetratricopeptide repeat protein [Ignavibacteriaceae bacterium]|nr:tetratricopeptide repeat protein [Ignavibacteriaceae bacterium]